MYMSIWENWIKKRKYAEYAILNTQSHLYAKTVLSFSAQNILKYKLYTKINIQAVFVCKITIIQNHKIKNVLIISLTVRLLK